MTDRNSYFSDEATALKKECDSLYPEILTLRHDLTLEGTNVDSGSFMADYATALTSLKAVMVAEKERLEDVMQSLRQSQSAASSGP